VPRRARLVGLSGGVRFRDLLKALQRLRHASTQAMGTVEVHGVIDGDLPAAVEVAAYRIALEAMTNAVRHGGGQWCRVNLELNGALNVVIEDDGLGMPDRFRAGVGLTSMRERASELGGTCSITRRDPTGTTVCAVLPLTAGPR
jgi:two-component system, NarL family, sensor kinase